MTPKLRFMRCLGRTELLNRCKKDCKFLLCKQHRFQWIGLVIGIIGLVASITAIILDTPSLFKSGSPKKTLAEEVSGSRLQDSLPIVPMPLDHLAANENDCVDTIDYRGINIIKEERVFDFRKSCWLNDDQNNPFASPVTLKRTVFLTRDSAKNKFTLRFSTSGTAVYARCINRDYQYCIPKKVVMQDPGKRYLMKSIDIIVDITHYRPKDTFQLIYEITYFNGFQSKEEEWFGTSTLGASLAKDLSVLCYFSKSRSPKDVRVCGYKAYVDSCYKISNLNLAFAKDSLSFGWRILSNGDAQKFDGIDTRWVWKR